MNKLSETGIRMTPQRMAIVECLEGNTDHPSAEDIFTEVKARYPSMSFATVYNTLETLKRTGLVRELTIDSARKRYDPDIEPHHHMICDRCKKVIDVNLSFDIIVPEDQLREFNIKGNHVEFYGTCKECRP